MPLLSLQGPHVCTQVEQFAKTTAGLAQFKVPKTSQTPQTKSQMCLIGMSLAVLNSMKASECCMMAPMKMSKAYEVCDSNDMY